MIMSIVDNIEKFARLRQKSPNFTIRPARNNRLPILHKEDTVALKPRDLDSQQLLSVLGIPDTNLVDGCSGKHIRVPIRKNNIIDSIIMTSVSEFWNQGS